MSKQYPLNQETRREFIREKRRQIKRAKKASNDLRIGCALNGLFDGTSSFRDAVYDIHEALDKIDKITKPLS